MDADCSITVRLDGSEFFQRNNPILVPEKTGRIYLRPITAI